MVKCVRCWVQSAMICMNAFVNLCGAAMIIYSLWLDKMWYNGLHQLPYILNIPKPWFIYTCLSVGMAVCLSTVFGHAIANYCFTNSALCIYVVALTSLLLFEVAVVVLIFFNINWSKLVIEYIDEHHRKFRSFVVFHLHMCRLIVILIVVLQVIVVMFAAILWSIGTEPRYGHRLSRVPDFKQSFLVGPNVLVIDEPVRTLHNGSYSHLQTCITCGEFSRNRRETLVSYCEGVITARFRRRTTVIDI